jgi:hypothetical protein
MARPLGCLTASALIAAAVAVAAIGGSAALSGNGIFSPGELSGIRKGAPIGGVASHAELGASCASCHPAFWSGDRMGDLCIACHTEVGQEISSGSGFHGGQATTANCRDCHTDHRGATASLTLANPRSFPHERTGFSLRAHAPPDGAGGISCTRCHPDSLRTFSAPACLTCHQGLDPAYLAKHTTAFGTACLGCHDGVDSYGKAFAHATYPLAGSHQQATCEACHPGATTLATLRAAPTECFACHSSRDIHEGRLGTACGACHSAADWAGATIDHDRTRLPLVGRHVGVLCESCHVDRHWTGIGTTCASCHTKDDPHGGRMPGDCAACHAATGWKDITFDHNKTGFVVDGAHTSVGCAACHPGDRFVGTPTTCSACHGFPASHGSTFGSNCVACHTTATWNGATVNHNLTAFPLTGAHVSVACTLCHVAGVFKGTPTTCSACHPTPSTHGSARSGDCAACHTTATWSGASFDHNLSVFPLTGAHVSVSCTLCHVGGVYKGTPTACSACHASPATHPSSFGSNCAACHSTTTWSGGTYNGPHTFPMSHGNAGGVCSTCHPTTFSAYSCAQCHAPADMATRHAAVSGFSQTTCASCHPPGATGG